MVLIHSDFDSLSVI